MEMYVANKDIHEMMYTIIRDYHHDLLAVMDEIVIIFREKASKSGGKAVLGKSKKAPPLIHLLGDKDYKFIIELAADVWNNELATTQQVALLDHHLCACRMDFDEKTGEYKCSIAPPDFVGYKDEIERHGVWRPSDDEGETSPMEQILDGDEG